MNPVPTPFQQVGHAPPRLPWFQRLGSLGLAFAATGLLVALVFVLWWAWLTWMPIPDPKDGPIPVLLDVQGGLMAAPPIADLPFSTLLSSR